MPIANSNGPELIPFQGTITADTANGSNLLLESSFHAHHSLLTKDPFPLHAAAQAIRLRRSGTSLNFWEFPGTVYFISISQHSLWPAGRRKNELAKIKTEVGVASKCPFRGSKPDLWCFSDCVSSRVIVTPSFLASTTPAALPST